MRSAVSSDAGRAGDGERGLAGLGGRAVGGVQHRLPTSVPPTRSKTAAATGIPASMPGDARHDVAGAPAPGGHGGVRRDVRAEGEVLLQGPADDPHDLGGVEPAWRQGGGQLGPQCTASPVMPPPGRRRGSGPARCGCARARRVEAVHQPDLPLGPGPRGVGAAVAAAALGRGAGRGGEQGGRPCAAPSSRRAARTSGPAEAGDAGEQRRPGGPARRRRGATPACRVVAAVIVVRAAGSTAPPCPRGPAPARRAAGRSAASSAAQRRAATSPSVIEFEASRLAPWTPVQATSPTAKRPATLVRPSRSATTPPQE